MDGHLPHLDATLDSFRTFWAHEISGPKMVLILVFITGILAYLDQFGILPPFLLSSAVSMISFNYYSSRNLQKFWAWKNLWPSNLLIPGLYESALMKFVLRRNLDSSLLLICISTGLCIFPSGFLVCSILAFSVLFVICWDLTITTLLAILLPFGTSFLPIPQEYIPILWIQMLPLMYLTWKLQKPQLLWPLLLLNSYTVDFQSLTFLALQILSCLILALQYKTKRFKYISIIPLLILIISLWHTKAHLIQGQNLKTLDWNEYNEKCVTENAWTQTSGQQLECAKFIGMSINWTGQVSGVKIIPRNKLWTALYSSLCTLFHYGNVHLYCHSNIEVYECYLKINMLQRRSIMGSGHFLHVYARLSDANQCLKIQIGTQMQFKGRLTETPSGGHEESTKLYIQTIIPK